MGGLPGAGSGARDGSVVEAGLPRETMATSSANSVLHTRSQASHLL